MPQAASGNTITDSAQVNAGVIQNSDLASTAVKDNVVDAAAAIAMSKLSLAITNSEVAPGAAIVDTKLAQIATASKVSGAALTSLASIPAGAGVIPSANIPSQAGDLVVDVMAGEMYSVTNALTGGATSYGAYYPCGATGDHEVFGQVKVPKGATSISAIYAIITNDGTTGDIYHGVYAASVDLDAASAAPTIDAGAVATETVPGTADLFKLYTMPAAGYNGIGAIDENDWILFKYYRAANNAPDTAGASKLYAVRFVFA